MTQYPITISKQNNKKYILKKRKKKKISCPIMRLCVLISVL